MWHAHQPAFARESNQRNTLISHPATLSLGDAAHTSSEMGCSVLGLTLQRLSGPRGELCGDIAASAMRWCAGMGRFSW